MTSARPKLVVIGNGMAGMHAVEELLKLAPDLYDITVFDEEPHSNYNRIPLSPVLAGEEQVDDIMLNTREWYDQNRTVLHVDDPVVTIDRPRHTLRSRDGVEIRYDRLLIATGSRPFILPVPGRLLPGVIAFRDIQDVETMLGAARNHRHAVVIGGGPFGLKTANGLIRQGMNVMVVHLPDTPIERRLDKPAVQLLQKALEAKGPRFLLGACTAELLGTDRVTAVRFKDGTQIPADLVVMTADVRPNIELAKAVGLHCERAIIVDDTLQTYDPRIYAVGECVQHRSAMFGLVAPIQDQARVCATYLAGAGHRRYVQQAAATKLKVTGVDLYSIGGFISGDDAEDIVLRDPYCGVYKRLVLKEDRIVGVVLYGSVADGLQYFDLIQREVPIMSIRQRLLSGRALCEAEAA